MSITRRSIFCLFVKNQSFPDAFHSSINITYRHIWNDFLVHNFFIAMNNRKKWKREENINEKSCSTCWQSYTIYLLFSLHSTIHSGLNDFLWCNSESSHRKCAPISRETVKMYELALPLNCSYSRRSFFLFKIVAHWRCECSQSTHGSIKYRLTPGNIGT